MNLPRISWSTIASTHLPHIHWPRDASQVTNCQAPKRGGGGDRPLIRGPKIPKISPQMFRTKIVHTSGTFFENVRKMSKNLLKPCYHIEFNTTNPNTILKITISFIKHQNGKILSIFYFLKVFEKSEKKTQCLFCIMYKFHNSYFIIL